MEITPNENTLLEKHLTFYESLDNELREPKTDLQKHFVQVCRGLTKALTDHEIAYMKYKREQARKRLAKVKANEATQEIEEGYPTSDWASYIPGQFD
jgi:uncharacterized protein YifE (UPF0438 family)